VRRAEKGNTTASPQRMRSATDARIAAKNFLGAKDEEQDVELVSNWQRSVISAAGH
jgi:hypothetical protein